MLCNSVANAGGTVFVFFKDKKKRKIMKKATSLIFACALLMICVTAAGAVRQDGELRKEMEDVRDSVQAAAAAEAVRNMNFVLEAERLVLVSGESVVVSSVTNFVSVSDDRAVIQVAPLRGPGVNGVGGITVEGTVSGVRFDTDRRGNTILYFNVSGAAASCRITLTLPKDGVDGRMRIDPNFSSDDITLVGTVVPEELSTVHQGRTL